MAWLCTVLIESCTVVHYVSLLSCYTAYILFCYRHTAFPLSCCFATITLQLRQFHVSRSLIYMLLCFCDAAHSLPLSCCFVYVVMLLCFCHAALPLSCFLPLSCCFASVMLFCLSHAVLPLSCCFGSVMLFFFAFVMLLCLCHAVLPLSCCFAYVSCLCHFVLPLSCFFACEFASTTSLSYLLLISLT